MNIGILGLGEVGKAIFKLTKQKHTVFVKELTYDHIKNNHIDILHICIPFNRSFISTTTKAIKSYQPSLVIINSTVKPGTTDQLFQKTHSNLVHAPIDGVHPHLYEYLFKFTKPIGAINPKSYQLASKHFRELGVKTIKFDSPLETELAKILSTTYYGWNIIFEKWTHQLCQKHKANYDQVYTKYNQIYNQGYQTDLPQVIRPVLAHKSGEIGGHCVIPNAKIIESWQKNPFTRFILAQNHRHTS